MLNVTLAGNTGRDAQHRTTQGGADLCSFSVACDVGFGENKQTYWVDVTRWGKGAEGLARILVKGSKVTVTGELTTREHEGKTYLQCRADHVAIQGTPQRSDSSGSHTERYSPPADQDELDDEIPF